MIKHMCTTYVYGKFLEMVANKHEEQIQIIWGREAR